MNSLTPVFSRTSQDYFAACYEQPFRHSRRVVDQIENSLFTDVLMSKKTTRKSNARYQKTDKRKVDLLRGAFSPKIMRYVIRDGKIDTWRARYFMQIFSEGAAIGASAEQIETAALSWIKNPNRKTLDQAMVNMTVESMGFSEEAKDCGLSAKEIMELYTHLEIFTGDGTQALNSQATFATLKRLGKKKGTAEVLNNAIRSAFNLPKEATANRKPGEVLDLVADLQGVGLDQHLEDARLWKEIGELKKGSEKMTQLVLRWANDPPNVKDQNGARTKPTPDSKSMHRRITSQSKIDDSSKTEKSNSKRANSAVTLDPIVVTASPKKKIVKETVINSNNGTNNSRMIIRVYEDETIDVLIEDDSGVSKVCNLTYGTFGKNPNTPVVVFKLGKCVRIPADGGSKRTPGPIRN